MGTQNSLIQKVVIPDYPDRILVSKRRNPVYYVSKKSKVKGKKTIPPTFLTSPLYAFDERGVLRYVATGLPKLANPQLAGKPRYWVVNFQDIWSGALSGSNRANKAGMLKEIFRPYIQALPQIETYPIRLELFIYDTACPVDIFNKGAIYVKIIEDLLVNTNKGEEDNRKIIVDDSIRYINDSGRIKFVKINEGEQKKMEIRIHRSDNLDQ